MPQRTYEDDPTLLGPILQSRLDELERALHRRLDQLEERIRAQERMTLWGWAVTVITVVLALVGVRLPNRYRNNHQAASS